MTLSNASSTAVQSLSVVSSDINVVSRNIGGANAPGFSKKLALLSTAADGSPELDGIRRAANVALFQNMLQSNAAQAQANVLSNAIARIDQFMNLTDGATASGPNGRSPAVLISALSSALQAYSAAPFNLATAQEALSRAKSLAVGLSDVTAETQAIRLQSDSEIADGVSEINSLLTTFEDINRSIVEGSIRNADITDDLDKRDGILSKLSQYMGIATVVRANNDMAVYTDSGATLFETTPRNVDFAPKNAFVAATVGNQVFVDGVQITGPSAPMAVRSGKLAGLVELRDQVAARFQSQLDEIARGLIAAFAESDQTNPAAPTSPGLFTFPGATTTPGVGLIPGLAGEILVNPNADPDQGGDLNRIRDGGISHPGNPAYILNPAGDKGFAQRLLQLNANISAQQAFDPAAGLSAQTSLVQYSTDSVAWVSAREKQFSASTNYQNALLSQSSQALSNATGVNLDEQMSKMLDLENSYQASAKLLATVDSMYQALFNAIHV
jgi:flagellar hook-associated protein 1 FlgK